MAQPKPALYAASVTGLAFVCLAMAAAAVGIPIWGYFENVNSGSWESERGYFGPWKTCKRLNYGRELCGDFRFRPSGNWTNKIKINCTKITIVWNIFFTIFSWCICQWHSCGSQLLTAWSILHSVDYSDCDDIVQG